MSIIDNPVTGETITFLEAPDAEDRVRLRVEMLTRPGGAPAGAHIHPHQDERFEVVDGRFEFEVAKERFVLGDRETITVPEGEPHMWRNVGDGPGRMIIEWTPAGRTREMFETLFALSRDGQLKADGKPSLLHFSLMAPVYDLWAAQPPIPVQKALFSVLHPIARWRGLRATYP
jgi:mannose-6-phosphate isomerase-like protein (cupin superfamily)